MVSVIDYVPVYGSRYVGFVGYITFKTVASFMKTWLGK